MLLSSPCRAQPRWASSSALPYNRFTVRTPTTAARRTLQPRHARACRVHANDPAGIYDPIASNYMLRVYHSRPDGDFSDWGLHVWGAGVREGTEWDQPLPQSGQTSDGCFWDVQLQGECNTRQVGLIVHKGDWKSASVELQDLPASQQEVWLVDGHDEALPNLGAVRAKLGAMSAQGGIITQSAAHWVSESLLLWRTNAIDASGDPVTFKLLASATASITRTDAALHGAELEHALTPLPSSDSSSSASSSSRGARGPAATVSDALERFPHLAGCLALQLGSLSDEAREQVLTGQMLAAAFAADGSLLDVTQVQPQGVLDDRYFYDGPLGDTGSAIHVWAPTAQSVELLVTAPQDVEVEGYRSVKSATVVPMTRNAKGCWSAARPAAWDKHLYLFRVTAFHPLTQKVETMLSSDPYSHCLTADGELSMFVDLDRDESLMPPGWKSHTTPPLPDAVDTSVYELHIRDFSATDPSVPPHLQGKYLAFDPASTGSTPTNGQAHLQRLQESGLKCVHLLPAYDFGSVPERVADQRVAPDNLADFASDSDQQQLEVSQIASVDAFNWGYDPVHYGVPEGSYATDPDSASRVKEFRSMVHGLHGMGLRVVMDVVYNHTFASGLNQHSVLDRVVPGYYHRRTELGDYCNSTCCNNTATEHLMCERLMIDDLVHWATHYRVDGFRFDIMGHIMLSSMLKARKALDALSVSRDGVDGRSVYMYGEAWDFGEVACNQRGRNASQLNIGGTGLGAFNDRVRDACIGGSPFAPPTMQGLLTGLYLDPNPQQGPASPADLDTLLAYSDWLKVGLAGNLREYNITTAQDERLPGKRVLMGTTPVAYCHQPSENIVYLGCHDNETLFDNVVLKLNHLGDASAVARACQLAHGVVAVTQGVAFFHAGDDLLRSKSLDRDSYNSGDWFNAVDWTGQVNNYGVGLPIAAKNADHWNVKQPLLALASLAPSAQVIGETGDFFRAMLRVRYSTRLFRLPTSAAIQEQVTFENCGSKQVPGLIIMRVASSKNGGCVKDDNWDSVVVVLNATRELLEVPYPAGVQSLTLHPETADLPHVQGSSAEDEARTVSVAAQTFLVLCEPRAKNWFGF